MLFAKYNDMEKRPLKFIVLGDSRVGKTSLIRRYVDNTYRERWLPSWGVRVFIKRAVILPHATKRMDIALWDPGEHELYPMIQRDLFLILDGVIFVADVTRPETITNLATWMSEVKTHVHPFYQHHMGWAVALNKGDLLEEISPRHYHDTEDCRFHASQIEKVFTTSLTQIPTSKTGISERIFITSAKHDMNVSKVIHAAASSPFLAVQGGGTMTKRDYKDRIH